MKEVFFNRKVEYFWEYNYPFGETFLKEIFPIEYKRKYSLLGEGIFNLIYMNNKVYEAKFTEAKKMAVADGKLAARDDTKNVIVSKICDKLKEYNIEYTINSGKYITFKLGSYIAKIEVIKKMKEPE